MGSLLLTAAFSGCGTNKATEAAKTSADIESGKDDEVENAEEPEEEEEKPHGTVGVCLPLGRDRRALGRRCPEASGKLCGGWV